MKRALLLATAISLALSTPALAQATAPVEVDEVIVTATRLPAPIDVTPGAYVIDAVQIEQSGHVLAVDILSEVPGLSVYRSGPFGGVAGIRMRGTGQDKTLVLLDGVSLNDPSQPSGGYDFASLELADIERIEVLNGPQGSLWGSDAIGGVISLTSRELNGARLDLEAGSLNTLNTSAAVGTANARGAFGVFLSAIRTDGISKADEADGNPEVDGFESYSAGVNGRLNFGPLILDGRLRYNTAEADIDGFPAPAYLLADTPEVSDSEGVSGFVRARAELFGFEQSLSWSRSTLDRSITGGAFPSRYTADRATWRWQATNDRVTDRLGVVVGLEREHTTGDLSTGIAEDLGATSAFAAARFDATERLTASLSARLDDPDEYDAEATFRAGLAYDLGSGLTVTGSWGQGFKTPTISQTLCDFCFAFIPFPELRPERAEGFDLGLAWRSGDDRLGLRATAFRLEVEDEIIFFFDTTTFDSYYVNLARTESTGLELQGDVELGQGFGLSGGYTYTDAQDGITGARLLRVPEHAGSVTLDWSDGAWRGALTVRAESDMLDAGGTREGFVTGRFSGGYAINENVELTLRVENLADAHYQELLGYGEPGRTAYVGVRLRY
ncbi:TonB-dependent receptor plug domain-containing protein [Brevundimonas aveniformis]|uniref:TonB-dependent receptor plug domain-containing protein n=1 Tax=Brevundimonas aveniformis TaxID=370977 RepID=UPI0003FE7C86|nr:TonB-dependent receptor [Brevundimonas aveniformis]